MNVRREDMGNPDPRGNGRNQVPRCGDEDRTGETPVPRRARTGGTPVPRNGNRRAEQDCLEGEGERPAAGYGEPEAARKPTVRSANPGQSHTHFKSTSQYALSTKLFQL